MKKNVEDGAGRSASTMTTLIADEIDRSVLSRTEAEESLKADSPLLMQVLKALNLTKEKNSTAAEAAFEQARTESEESASTAHPFVRSDAAETMRRRPRGFDIRSYGRAKTARIICRNEGPKLTLETLAELECEGARLIPSLDL